MLGSQLWLESAPIEFPFFLESLMLLYPLLLDIDVSHLSLVEIIQYLLLPLLFRQTVVQVGAVARHGACKLLGFTIELGCEGHIFV